ncbi:hypothetical protein EGU54_09175 [Achromobacter aegrifaciens]|nr:hypothetical protein EGU54_09175 [Achromobacter aegrifaciens]
MPFVGIGNAGFTSYGHRKRLPRLFSKNRILAMKIRSAFDAFDLSQDELRRASLGEETDASCGEALALRQEFT